MDEDLERRLRAARESLRGPSPEATGRAGAATLAALEDGRPTRRRGPGRRGWGAVALALVFAGTASALALGPLGDLFVGTPPPEVERAFLLAGGGSVPAAPADPRTQRSPERQTTAAARLIVADTPWGRYAYWRGLDRQGELTDLIQHPDGGFSGSGPCLAFDPVIPPDPPGTRRVAVPDVAGLGRAAARSRLRAAGFRVSEAPGPARRGGRAVFTPSPPGVVVTTLPTGGFRAFAGAPIELAVGSRETAGLIRRQGRSGSRGRPSPKGDIELCGAGTMEPGRTPTIQDGAVSPRVASAELEYADGRRLPAFVANRAILVVVPPQSCEYGLEPPRALVLRDGDGTEVDRVALGERGFGLAGWELPVEPACGRPEPRLEGPVRGLFSVLDRRPTPADRLPSALRRSGFQNLKPRTARLAAVVGGRRLFVVAARPYPAFPDGLCLIDV